MLSATGLVMHRLGYNLMRRKYSLGMGSVATSDVRMVEIDVVEISAAIAKQADLGEQDVAVGNGIGSSGLEIRGKRCL